MKKIKDVVAITGLSKRTLQYYDDRGLIKVKRTAENYRFYEEEDLQKLWELLIYREMGFPLDEIADLLNGREEGVQGKIKERILYIDQRIQELEKMKRLAEKVLNYGMPGLFTMEQVAELGNYKELARRLAEQF